MHGQWHLGGAQVSCHFSSECLQQPPDWPPCLPPCPSSATHITAQHKPLRDADPRHSRAHWVQDLWVQTTSRPSPLLLLRLLPLHAHPRHPAASVWWVSHELVSLTSRLPPYCSLMGTGFPCHSLAKCFSSFKPWLRFHFIQEAIWGALWFTSVHTHGSGLDGWPSSENPPCPAPPS